MKKIAVLYYSRTGNTRAMADLIAEGARRVPGTHVDVSPIEEFAV
ncbi:MAG: flavodoxin domain-containing protein, partial [Candidatus Omnitrophota bacterium]